MSRKLNLFYFGNRFANKWVPETTKLFEKLHATADTKTVWRLISPDRERGIMEFPVERQARSGLISERFLAPHALLPVEEGLPAASLRGTVVRELDRESWKAHNFVW